MRFQIYFYYTVWLIQIFFLFCGHLHPCSPVYPWSYLVIYLALSPSFITCKAVDFADFSRMLASGPFSFLFCSFHCNTPITTLWTQWGLSGNHHALPLVHTISCTIPPQPTTSAATVWLLGINPSSDEHSGTNVR